MDNENKRLNVSERDETSAEGKYYVKHSQLLHDYKKSRNVILGTDSGTLSLMSHHAQSKENILIHLVKCG